LLGRFFASAAIPLAVLLVVLVASCTKATSRVTPVPEAALQQAPAPEQEAAGKPAGPLKRICLIENPRVKFDFLEAYRRALSSSGYEVQVYPKTPPASQCPLTTRYVAYWNWDIVLYLGYAELRVFRDGQPVGRAEFKAGSSRFTDAELPLKNLIDQLLPK
jgi:hypothetical protein